MLRLALLPEIFLAIFSSFEEEAIIWIHDGFRSVQLWNLDLAIFLFEFFQLEWLCFQFILVRFQRRSDFGEVEKINDIIFFFSKSLFPSTKPSFDSQGQLHSLSVINFSKLLKFFEFNLSWFLSSLPSFPSSLPECLLNAQQMTHNSSSHVLESLGVLSNTPEAKAKSLKAPLKSPMKWSCWRLSSSTASFLRLFTTTLPVQWTII